MLRPALTRLARTPRRSISSSAIAQRERSVPATFYRGGTSKALVFNVADLPTSKAERETLLLSAMGSPDPNGRQLDGMGGGYSSVSKVALIAKGELDDIDVEYTFGQVLVDRPVVDYSSNCGNMLAAVGPFALEHGLVPPATGDIATVRILNTNTGKIIHSHFPARGDRANLQGGFTIDGVSGSHARIALDFINPEGSRTGVLLPTGNVIDTLDLPGGSGIKATLMDCGNPCVFILFSDLPIDPTILPPALERDTETLTKLNDIRNAAAVKMGLVSTLEEAQSAKSVPKVCIVSPSVEHTVLSGVTVTQDEVDLVVRCISSGDPHRALPITAALCTAAAAQVDGSLVHSVTRPRIKGEGIVIGHASGTITVDADLVDGDGSLHVPLARVFRTARKLFEGKVFYDDGF